MTATVLTPSDISTEATDFQADGTEAPGTTGRVADAGHVHPSSTPGLVYQVVNSDPVLAAYSNGAGAYSMGGATLVVTVDAPTGFVIIGYGFEEANGSGMGVYPPAGGGSVVVSSDGTSVTFTGVVGTVPTQNESVGTCYATCIGIALY